MEFSLSDQEYDALLKLSKGRKLQTRYKERIKIVLTYHKLGIKTRVCSELKEYKQKVDIWLSRWNNNLLVRQDLEILQKSGSLKYRDYQAELLSLFADEFRSGKPPTFTQSQIEQIVALASESPPDLGLPFTHWSDQLLKEEVINRNIVCSISTRQIGRFLKYAQTSPPFERLLDMSEDRRLG